jgi:pyruvate dehydrogenase E2 component (dihydrolipoamide acetyltransferase)
MLRQHNDRYDTRRANPRGALSVATEVKLPRLGQGMESGTIVRWLKGEGDTVRRSEPLYELDTDKVTQEVEAEADGVLLRILVADGEVEVGTTVALIGAEGEDASAAVAPEVVVDETASGAEGEDASAAVAPEVVVDETAGAAPDAASKVQEAVVPDDAPAPVTSPAQTNGRVKASPLARRMARERGVDLQAIVGTGPDGRVVAEDVEQAASSGGAVSPATQPVVLTEVEILPLTSIRKTIARRLTEAWTAPVFQLGAAADATEVLALRETLVARLKEGAAKPTVNDLLVKLAAVALVRHPAVNAQFTGDEIHRYPNAHIGIAVAAPNGLVVPVIRGAERLGVQEIASARADLVTRARDGKLTLADMEGGTFTISNLGMFGVGQFTAVLNPPQVAILAVGAVSDEAVVVEGEIEIAPIMHLSLTCDHRAIDGADGAQFLQTLVALIEQPALAL